MLLTSFVRVRGRVKNVLAATMLGLTLVGSLLFGNGLVGQSARHFAQTQPGSTTIQVVADGGSVPPPGGG